MKTIIEATGLDFSPKLVETDNGWATVYGQQVREFDNLPTAMQDFNSVCIHVAQWAGIYDDSDLMEEGE